MKDLILGLFITIMVIIGILDLLVEFLYFKNKLDAGIIGNIVIYTTTALIGIGLELMLYFGMNICLNLYA